jgi:hypothetical protein
MKKDLGKTIVTFYDNLQKRKELDEELKFNLSQFFNIVDEQVKTSQLELSQREWQTMGELASRSVESTESLLQFTNFIAKKF